jgi:hypothetical protein
LPEPVAALSWLRYELDVWIRSEKGRHERKVELERRWVR